MVYQLAGYINRDREVIPQASITKPPSAELRPNQTDQDTLPDYDILDQILQLYVEEDLWPDGDRRARVCPRDGQMGGRHHRPQ